MENQLRYLWLSETALEKSKENGIVVVYALVEDEYGNLINPPKQIMITESTVNPEPTFKYSDSIFLGKGYWISTLPGWSNVFPELPDVEA